MTRETTYLIFSSRGCPEYHQFQSLSGGNLRKLIYLIFIKPQLLKLIKTTHLPELRQRNYDKSQTSPMIEPSPQVSGSHTEPLLGNETGNTPVQSLNHSKKSQSEIHWHEMSVTAKDNEDANISLPKITTSQIEEQLVRDDITNELYMPISSTIVLKWKKEMLYVPLEFENGLTIHALVDSRAFVSASAETELVRIERQAPANNFKNDDRPNFQIQVPSGQLEELLSTATLKLDFGDNISAENFVVMKILTGSIIGVHFMRHNSVVLDATHGLIQF